MYHWFLALLAACFLVLAWRNQKLGLFLIAATLPAYLLRFSVAGFPSTVLEVMILGLTAIWFIKLLLCHPERSEGSHLKKILRSLRSLRMTREWWLALSFLLVAASVSVLVAPDHLAALGIWRAYFLEPMLLFVVAVHLMKSRRDVEHLFTALALGSLFVALVAILQYVTGIGIPAPWDIERRVTSIFAYPNAVGLYLGPIVVIGIFFILNAVKKYPLTSPYFRGTTSGMTTQTLWFWIATVALGLLTMIAAQSEAAIAATIITTLGIFLFSKPTRRPAAVIGLLLVLLVLAIAPLRGWIVQKATLRDTSGETRRLQWSETWSMLHDRPLTGAGLTGYPSALAPYHARPEIEIFQYPHQIILNIWSELGVLGLIAFVSLASIVVKEIFFTPSISPFARGRELLLPPPI